MDYIIETHVNQVSFTSFQSRVINYSSFEDYIKRLKNNECFTVTDMFGKNVGHSLPRNMKIRICKEDIQMGIFVYKISLWNGEPIMCYLQKTHEVPNNINRRIK